MTRKNDRKSTSSTNKSVSVITTPRSSGKTNIRKNRKVIKSKYPIVHSQSKEFKSENDGLSVINSKNVPKATLATEYTSYLEKICSFEKSSLQKLFEEMEQENPSSLQSIKDIEQELYGLLDNIPTRFQEEYLKTEEQNIVFQPEYSSVQKSLLEFKQKQFEVYSQYYQTLLQYEQDLGTLKQQENLWLGKIPIELTVMFLLTSFSYFLLMRFLSFAP
jgi:hypothetical protein